MTILINPDILAAAETLWPGDVNRENRIARVAWSILAEPGDARAQQMIGRLGAAPSLILVCDSKPEPWGPSVPGLHREVLAALETCIRMGIEVLTPADEVWPERVDDAKPFCLYVRGNTAALGGARNVAIVGARAASAYGEEVARQITEHLVAKDVTIISGGGYGIDGTAHRAALDGSGLTVAVMAGGLDRIYPAGHAHLLGRIADDRGALVSEVPPWHVPTKLRFIRRARLIAALSDAVVVAEAGPVSGSLRVAWAADEFGRKVAAVPGSVISATSAGANAIIRSGLAALVTSAADVLTLTYGEGA